MMHIISKPPLRAFWSRHPDAARPLLQWHTVLEHADAKDFSGLKRTFNTVDWAGGYVIFNVGGNKYRIVADVVFRTQTIFIKYVFTHKEYDSWKP